MEAAKRVEMRHLPAISLITDLSVMGGRAPNFWINR